MINYSELSDFEINCLIARRVALKDKTINIYEDAENKRVTVCLEGFAALVYDHCNNWEQAGNLIDLIFSIDGYTISVHEDYVCISSSDRDYEVEGKNPKRAISECYLMMMEYKK